MVSFSCESCQDTIKKPKLENVLSLSCMTQLIGSMRRGVGDRLPASIAIPPSKDGIGRDIFNASPRNRSIRKETERYLICIKELIGRRMDKRRVYRRNLRPWLKKNLPRLLSLPHRTARKKRSPARKTRRVFSQKLNRNRKTRRNRERPRSKKKRRTRRTRRTRRVFSQKLNRNRKTR